MQTLKQKDPLSWLNKIVLGRLVSEMSAATEWQKRNDKRGGAKFSKIDIRMRRYNEETKFSVTPSFVLTHSSDSN